MGKQDHRSSRNARETSAATEKEPLPPVAAVFHNLALAAEDQIDGQRHPYAIGFLRGEVFAYRKAAEVMSARHNLTIGKDR